MSTWVSTRCVTATSAQAKVSFAAAIEIDPYFPVSHYGLARAHALAKEFEPALQAIDAAIALAPERAYYHARKGLLLLQAGQLEAADRSVEEACCKAPDNPFDADLIIANPWCALIANTSAKWRAVKPCAATRLNSAGRPYRAG